MLRVFLAFGTVLASADAFSVTPNSPIKLRIGDSRVLSSNFARSIRASSAGEVNNRKEFLRQLAVSVMGFGSAVVTQTTGAYAFQYDPKEGQAAREAYLEDVKSIRKSRWTRQPTRIDVDRNVKRIVAIHNVMVDAEGALKNNDLKAVADAIGDQTIEATKKNVNLDRPIPETQKAKPFMYGYAQLFSKNRDSPLTTDLKKAADDFFASIAAAREKALAGDADGTRTNLSAAATALQAYVDAIEAESLKGRINTIKVSVGRLVGRVDPEGDIDVAAENARAVRGGRERGFL